MLVFLRRHLPLLAMAAATCAGAEARAQEPAGSAPTRPARPARAVRVLAQKDACPSPEAVTAELRRALPGVRFGEGEDAVAVGYVDLGTRYNVFVGDVHREFVDPERLCDERARAIAVLVALILEPPAAPAPSPSLPSPVLVPVTSEPRWPARSASWLRDLVRVELDAAGQFALAPGTPGPPVAGGASVHAAAMLGPFGLVLGAAGFSPARIAVASGEARLTRFPIDLSLRGALRRGRFEGALDLGLAVTVMAIRGSGFSVNEGDTRADPGLRAALALRVHVRRLAPFASAEAFVGPVHDLAANGAVAATTPRLWLQFALGVVVDVR